MSEGKQIEYADPLRQFVPGYKTVDTFEKTNLGALREGKLHGEWLIIDGKW